MELLSDPLPEAAARLRELIASEVSELALIRAGYFCLSPTFADDLDHDAITTIYKVLRGGPDPHRVEFLSRRSEAALVQSIDRNDGEALKRAVAYGSLAVHFVDKALPERGIVVSAFARTLRQRWYRQQEDGQLDEAIDFFRKAVEIEPDDEPNRPLHLDDLAKALSRRFKKTHRTEDFQEARSVYGTAIACGHDATPAFWSGLGQLLLEQGKFVHPKVASTFDEAIQVLNRAVESITTGFKGSVANIYHQLGLARTSRYLASEDEEEWEEATRCFNESIARLQNAPGADSLTISYSIGRAYSDVSGQFGRLEDSIQAEKLYRMAMGPEQSNPTAMASLAEELRYRATRTGSRKDLNEAIDLIERALSSSSPGDVDLPFRMRRCGDAYQARFSHAGHTSDIDRAINLLWNCLDLKASAENERWSCLLTLSYSLLLRYESTENIDDLQNAEAVIRSALDCNGLQPKDKASCLRILGNICLRQYKKNQDLEKLQDSMNKYRESNMLAPSDYLTINDLGNAYVENFEFSKSNADLQAATELYCQALEKLQLVGLKSGRRDEAMLLNGIGNVRMRRYEFAGRTSDLDAAISFYKRSLDAAPDFDVRKSTRTGTLVWALLHRWNLTQKVENLQDAEMRLEEFRGHLKQLSPAHRAYLENRMGMVDLFFFYHTLDPERLKPAAMHFRSALTASALDSANAFSATINLARTLEHKAALTKSDNDISEALSQYHGLLQSLDDSSPQLGTVITNLFEFIASIYEIKKTPTAGKMALSSAEAALKIKRVAPMRMISTWMKAARLHFTINGDAVTAYNLLKLAIDQLPEAILTGMTRVDQLRLIKNCSWLPSHTAAFSIAAGNTPEESLKIFESSRSIIWDKFLNEKADIAQLEDDHPKLASRLRDLQARLATPTTKVRGIETRPEPALMRQSQDQHQASLDYNILLKEIRILPGLGDFARVAQDGSSLVQDAENGPIIIVNSSEFRSDCFIIKPQGVISIPLPNMTLDACAQHCGIFLAALRMLENDPQEASRRVDKVLLWLWDAVAEPIMRELGYLDQGPGYAQDSKPRVWWMSTGWLTILPIHAAGDHKRALKTGASCSVLDLTVSSYFNSLRSLRYLRQVNETSHAMTGSSMSALLVKMPKTPDHPDLDHTVGEVSHMEDFLRPLKIDTIVPECPTRDLVVQHFSQSDMAHFACHGMADLSDPSRSKVLLRDWKQRPLNVRVLLRLKNVKCRLVYLSACESAVGREIELREEGLHLAGGFQLASVPHVVGTMWSINDQFSAQVAKTFYAGLRDEDMVDIERSAEALRNAVKDARSQGVEPIRWAAYVHFGP